MDQCSSVMRSAQASFVFAIELADSEVKKSPERLVEAVQSEPVQKAIKAALDKEAKRLMKLQEGGKPLPSGEGTKVLTNLAKAVPPAIQNEIKKEIEASSDYFTLKRSLDQLQCSFKHSTVGMWIDENKGLLIGVAAGLAVGGAVALYVFESGDVPVKLLTDLAAANKDSLKTEVLGVLEIGVSTIKFRPSTREVQLGGFVAADLKGVKLKASVRGSAKKDEFASAAGTFQIAVPLGKDGEISGKATVAGARMQSMGGIPTGPVAYDYTVELKVSLKNIGGRDHLSLQFAADAQSKEGKHTVSGSAGATFKTGIGGFDSKLSLTGGFKHEVRSIEPDLNVNIGLQIDF